jgi:hypothetical protein
MATHWQRRCRSRRFDSECEDSYLLSSSSRGFRHFNVVPRTGASGPLPKDCARRKDRLSCKVQASRLSHHHQVPLFIGYST